MAYTILFILNAIGMILELAASRLMSPFFGNSNYVWTAIIGIILLASSLGNLLGGKLSKHKDTKLILTILLFLTALYLAATPLLSQPVLGDLRHFTDSIRVTSVIGGIIFFLIPATILGLATPILMQDLLKSAKTKDHGEISGKITAVIAIGSLIGTFAGGFWLIPWLGTKAIFISLAFITFITALLLNPSLKNHQQKLGYYTATAITAIATITLAIFTYLHVDSRIISIDTEYGRIIIEDTEINGESVRLYKQSGAYSSATYLHVDKQNDIVYPYIKKYDDIFKFIDAKSTLMIGGAAYQYPKYFIANYPDKTMDVVEIDPMSTEIAKKYFFLKESPRLGLINEDGRIYLQNTTKTYDAILNDAFAGENPVPTLATVEAAKLIKSKLNKNGVYFSNILGSVEGDDGKFLRAEVKTLSQVFHHVYILPVLPEYDLAEQHNWMVVATDNPYQPTDAIKYDVSDDLILTDDYCPVENLIQKH